MDPVLMIPKRRFPRPTLWLDASRVDLFTLEDTDRVATWTSREAIAFTAAGDARPTYGATSMTGGPGVLFALANNQRVLGTGVTENVSYFTALAYVQRPSSATSMDIFSHWDSGTNQRGWKIGTSGNSLRVYVTTNGTVAAAYKNYTGNLMATTPTTVGFTFSNGVLTIYQVGVAVASPTKTQDDAMTTIHASTAATVVGGSLNSGDLALPYSGYVRSAGIWNRALTAGEIRAWHRTR